MRRTLAALLLTLLVTPLPALCRACSLGTCPNPETIEEHGHAAMDHAAMDTADAPSCHQAAVAPNAEQTAKPDNTLRDQTPDPGCCSIMEASAPDPAVEAPRLNVSGVLATVELVASPTDRVASVAEPLPQPPPPLTVASLYTLLGSLLI